MQTSLKEQLAAAQFEVRAQADVQKKLSEASAKIAAEIRRVGGLKRTADALTEEAAQVGARRILGEATDAEAEAANARAAQARADAAGADTVIAQLNRENELVSQRYQSVVPAAQVAQNVCNQIRAAMVRESAEAAAAEYVAAANALGLALRKVVAHAKALATIPEAGNFAPWTPAAVEVPAFPELAAFGGNPLRKLVIAVGNPDQVQAETSAILRSLSAE